jgi:hypothetical protein
MKGSVWISSSSSKIEESTFFDSKQSSFGRLKLVSSKSTADEISSANKDSVS